MEPKEHREKAVGEGDGPQETWVEEAKKVVESSGAHVAYDDDLGYLDEDESDYDDDEEDDDKGCLKMVLTSQEQEWALRIKAFIANTPELASFRLSDMMVAQMAIASIEDQEMGDLAKIRTRIENYQGILESYGIDNTLEQGHDVLRRFVKDVLPGFVLNFYLHPTEGTYVLITDLNKYDPDIFDDDDKLLTWIQGCFYLNHCQCADFAAIRNGVTYITECQGAKWKSKYKNYVKAYQEWANILYGYPLHFTSIMHYHTGLFVNIMTSLGKRFLPSRIAKKFLFGYVSEEGRLDTVYLQPSIAAANQRTVKEMQDTLGLRYQNEAKFVL